MRKRILLSTMATGLLIAACQNNDPKPNPQNPTQETTDTTDDQGTDDQGTDVDPGQELTITKEFTTNFGDHNLRYLKAFFIDQNDGNKILDGSTEITGFADNTNEFTLNLMVKKDATIKVDIAALTTFTADGNTDGLALWTTPVDAVCNLATGSCNIGPTMGDNLPLTLGLHIYNGDSLIALSRQDSEPATLTITMPIVKANDANGYHLITGQFSLNENEKWAGSLPSAHEYKVQLIANGQAQPILTVNRQLCEAIYLYDQDQHATDLETDLRQKFGQEFDQNCLFAIQDIHNKAYCAGSACVEICPELPMEYSNDNPYSYKDIVYRALGNNLAAFLYNEFIFTEKDKTYLGSQLSVELPTADFSCYYDEIQLTNNIMAGSIVTINDLESDQIAYEPGCLYQQGSSFYPMVNNDIQIVDNFQNFNQLKPIALQGQTALLAVQSKVAFNKDLDGETSYYAVVLMTKETTAPEQWSYKTIFDPYDESWNVLSANNGDLDYLKTECDEMELFSANDRFGFVCNPQNENSLLVQLTSNLNEFSIIGQRGSVAALADENENFAILYNKQNGNLEAVDNSGKVCRFALQIPYSAKKFQVFGQANDFYIYTKPWPWFSNDHYVFHVTCNYSEHSDNEIVQVLPLFTGDVLTFGENYIADTVDVFITDDGTIYSVDSHSAAIFKGNYSEASDSKIPMSIVTRFPVIDRAWALTTIKDNIYYISGNIADKLAKYDNKQNQATIVGWDEVPANYYHNPSNIAYDHNGHLLIGELMTGTIHQLDVATGKKLEPIATYNNGFGWIRDEQSVANGENFGHLDDLKVAPNGDIYVASSFLYNNASASYGSIQGNPQSAIFKRQANGTFKRVLGNIVADKRECYYESDTDLLSLCVNFGHVLAPLLDFDYPYSSNARFSPMVLVNKQPAVIAYGQNPTLIALNGSKTPLNSEITFDLATTATINDTEYLFFADSKKREIYAAPTSDLTLKTQVAQSKGYIMTLVAGNGYLFVISKQYPQQLITAYPLSELVQNFGNSSEGDPWPAGEVITSSYDMNGSLTNLNLDYITSAEYVPADSDSNRPSMLCFVDRNYGNVRCLINPELVMECNKLAVIVDNTLGFCQNTEEPGEECKTFLELYGKCEKYLNSVKKAQNKDNLNCQLPAYRSNIISSYTED